MELITELEFNKYELHKVEEVRSRLAEEGWKEISEITFSKSGETTAIKYKWVRYI